MHTQVAEFLRAANVRVGISHANYDHSSGVSAELLQVLKNDLKL